MGRYQLIKSKELASLAVLDNLKRPVYAQKKSTFQDLCIEHERNYIKFSLIYEITNGNPCLRCDKPFNCKKIIGEI